MNFGGHHSPKYYLVIPKQVLLNYSGHRAVVVWCQLIIQVLGTTDIAIHTKRIICLW